MVFTIVSSALSCEVLVSEFQISVKHPEVEVKTQNTTLHFGHLNLFLVSFLWNTHHTVFDCHFEASNHYFAL
jgi:hypothetical protein